MKPERGGGASAGRSQRRHHALFPPRCSLRWIDSSQSPASILQVYLGGRVREGVHLRLQVCRCEWINACSRFTRRQRHALWPKQTWHMTVQVHTWLRRCTYGCWCSIFKSSHEPWRATDDEASQSQQWTCLFKSGRACRLVGAVLLVGGGVCLLLPCQNILAHHRRSSGRERRSARPRPDRSVRKSPESSAAREEPDLLDLGFMLCGGHRQRNKEPMKTGLTS